MGKKTKEYDLEARLIDFAVAMIDIVEALPGTRAGNHVVGGTCSSWHVASSKLWRSTKRRVEKRFYS